MTLILEKSFRPNPTAGVYPLIFYLLRQGSVNKSEDTVNAIHVCIPLRYALWNNVLTENLSGETKKSSR